MKRYPCSPFLQLQIHDWIASGNFQAAWNREQCWRREQKTPRKASSRGTCRVCRRPAWNYRAWLCEFHLDDHRKRSARKAQTAIRARRKAARILNTQRGQRNGKH